MQQTTKYKLNLIEPSDPFLPDALNANTRQLEQVVSGHLNDMDQRVTVLESLKIAYGAYQGDNTYPRFIPLPFTPKMVIVTMALSTIHGAAAFTPQEGIEDNHALRVAEGGFQLLHYDAAHFNQKPHRYCYLALG